MGRERQAMRITSMFSAVLAMSLCAASAIANAPTGKRIPSHPVMTRSGTIAGTVLHSGVRAYLGIPYAAPPVRDLRWREPQPAKSWDGVFHADRFAPQCYQPMRNSNANHYSGADVVSEDCLYLNAWTRPGQRKAPVIVYIHGGAFFIGSGSAPLYDGENLSQESVVFVNLNYRLGPLGFLALPELSKESPNHASGNYGLMDQIFALRWIRDNIDAFGGDPANITIVGQSAGSMSVLALQASPLAKGLFHRAVGMSGAMIDGPIRMPSLAQAEQDGDKLKAVWKARSLAELRAMPADRLIVPRVPGGPTTGPVVDGHVLPAPIPDMFARGAQSDVPLLVGFARDEALGGLGPVSGLADYMDKVRTYFGSNAGTVLNLYPANNDSQAKAAARRADRDATVVTSMYGWAALQSAYGKAPVYGYEFSRPHSYIPGASFSDLDPDTAGAYHTSEVPFWLGTLDAFNRYRPTRQWTRQDRAMSKIMMQGLVNFARTGVPTASAVTWPRYSPLHPKLVEWGMTTDVKPWPEQKKMDFFKDFHSKSALESKAKSN